MSKLTLVEKELVPVYETDTGRYVVSGRDLWEALKNKRQFTNWIDDRLNECDAVKDEDYEVFNNFVKNPKGGRPTKEYIIKLDAAKEMAMLERNETGKKVRKHFIEIEKKYKQGIGLTEIGLTGKGLMALALIEAEKEIKSQHKLVKELKKKADYTDSVLKSKSLVTTNQIAQDYGMTAQAFNKILHELKVQYKQTGQWLLYQPYRDKEYVQSETIGFTHSDGRLDINMTTKWTQKGRLFLYNLLKENEIFPAIEKSELEFIEQ